MMEEKDINYKPVGVLEVGGLPCLQYGHPRGAKHSLAAILKARVVLDGPVTESDS